MKEPTADIYIDKGARELYREKYFTRSGERALVERLKMLVLLHAAKSPQYPYKERLLGFPALEIHSKAHHEGMIDDLCQILGVRKDEIIVEARS